MLSGKNLFEWLCQEVVKAVPHRHAVLSIPKILRRYFLCDRSLLSDLSRCGWEALKAFYTAGVRDSKAVPVEDPVFSGGAVVAIQTSASGSETSGSERDFPVGFHPHLHILISEGYFHENGMFSVSPSVDTKTAGLRLVEPTPRREQIFPAKDGIFDRHKVLKPELTDKAFRKNWARLIQKIYPIEFP